LETLGKSSGDEMNMHMPQNVLAETELRHLAAIPYQIVSPSSNAPIIGIYQDSLLGSYRFTRPGIKLSPRDAMNLLMMYPNVDVEALKGKKEITSFDVISQILPPMTMSYKTKLWEEGEDYGTSNNVLEIHKGRYVRGQMEKSMLGSSSKGMIHRVYNDYGNMAAANFIDNLQNIINEYMKISSFSVGISDLIADKETAKKIVQVIDVQKLEVQSLINKVHLGIFENNTASSNNVEFETQVGNLLNEATNQAGKKARESLSKDNRFLMIVNSGSKGTLINISQMISCLGQQNVDGKRIPYGFDSRTLPHYSKFDDSPKARGFIENSYISGLTAPELFFHAMGGRIGLIDTAVKTSQTGYIQRRLIKGLEDIKVEYDMTVRNSKGKIIQFAYGDDGIDTVKVEDQAIPLVGMSLEDIYMHYDIAGLNERETGLLEIYSKGTITRMRNQRADTKAKCMQYIEKMIVDREHLVEKLFKNRDENNVRLPVAFQYIIANIQGQLGLTANSAVDITPLETFKIIEQYFARLKRSHYVPPTRLFEIMYFYYLSPRNLLVAKRFNRKSLTMLLETIELKYKQSIVHPGEMVGVIAGQSIGEPTTQLTLNSVTYETEIIVRNGNKQISKLQIGDFITHHIANPKTIDYNAEKDTTYAELSEIYEVPCATENGETVWRIIEAVTQHPVVNEDGSNTMLKFVTEGCREIIVTKAKSLLQLVDGKIVPANGDSFVIGDYLPVSRKTLEYVRELKLSTCEKIVENDYIKSYGIVPNLIDGEIVMEERNNRFPDLEFDRIVSITEIANTTKYAYDLTVEETRNFDCANGLCLRDTFHLAGVASKSNVTRGVPRIEEILRLTKNPKNPSLTVHLKTLDESEKDKAILFANMMEHTKLVDVVKSIKICFDPKERSSLIEEDGLLMEQYYEFENLMKECNDDDADDATPKSKWIIRMELDAEVLLDKNITTDDIHFAIKNSYHGKDITCVYSDYNMDKLVFRIRMNSSVFAKGRNRIKVKGVIDSLDQSDEIYMLKNFQDTLLNNIVLRGINGIANVIPRKLQNMVVKDESKYVRKDVWVLDTTGSNLLETLALDFIDNSRTYSNDIKEVFDVLGIEAARQIIYNELNDVMEFSGGVYINYHHISLLCDRMTCTKDMVSIFRSGILNDDIGPIAKGTFEVHTEVFLDAARHGEFDHMRGVSANVMCGQFGYYGTNAFNVVLDLQEMAKLGEANVNISTAKDELDKLQGKKLEETGACGKQKLTIKTGISNINGNATTGCDDDYNMGF
jgi:DNA-directed RNA polymerase beta' subunit